MKILKLSSDQFNIFLDFNKRIFPQRRNIEEYFQYFYIDNPLISDNNPVGYLAWHENEIIGQFLLTPVSWRYREQTGTGYYGCDYYVDKAHSNSGAGAFLALKAVKGHRPYFTIGASEEAEKITLSLKTRYIGDLIKYIRFRGLFAPAKALLFKALKKDNPLPGEYEFPESIRTKETIFNRVLEPFKAGPIASPFLEFSRDPSFMEWRLPNPCTGTLSIGQRPGQPGSSAVFPFGTGSNC